MAAGSLASAEVFSAPPPLRFTPPRGLTTGLTLWGALIKGTSLLAPHDQQGRFFGLLESGRGLVEALLASIGLAVFAYFLNSVGTGTSESLTAVIWFYGLVSIGFTPILFFALRTSHMEALPDPNSRGISGLLQDLKQLLALLPSLPATISVIVLFPMVLLIGLFTYGVRGIFWATLDECDVSASTRGLAVGLISLLAYTPDIYVPMVQSWALANWSGQQGFQVYYGLFGASSVLGFVAARQLTRLGKA